MPHLFVNRLRQHSFSAAPDDLRTQWQSEIINAMCYLTGGIIFIAGSALFLPRYHHWIEWGSWLFIIGSLFYLVVAGHDLYETLHTAEPKLIDALAASTYCAGGLSLLPVVTNSCPRWAATDREPTILYSVVSCLSRAPSTIRFKSLTVPRVNLPCLPTLLLFVMSLDRRSFKVGVSLMYGMGTWNRNVMLKYFTSTLANSLFWGPFSFSLAVVSICIEPTSSFATSSLRWILHPRNWKRITQMLRTSYTMVVMNDRKDSGSVWLPGSSLPSLADNDALQFPVGTTHMLCQSKGHLFLLHQG